MHFADWDRAQRMFEMLLPLPLEERASQLHHVRGEDPELAMAVSALLEADVQPSILDVSRIELAQTALQQGDMERLVEQQIGPYRLLRLLGEGGMGVVYLAERLNIGGQVAIKLLRDSWMSPSRRHRFEAEKRSLARLSHANIARIYDAGALSDGTPWFVMEYVDGDPLTSWVVARASTIEQIFAIMEQVTDAVAYAHRHALVHRDLKPSNILVEESGTVKLLDFGIAKDLSEGTDLDPTIEGLRALTPAYAAPEQMRGGPIGVFTDVYSLGALLYELLTGELPHASEDRMAIKPSRVLRESYTKGRFKRSRQEWRELDAICLKALEFHADRRYPSAEMFQRDLRSFQEGQPLHARHPSVSYVAGKFVRRNRAVLMTLSFAVMLLITMAAVAAVRITRARDAALKQVARMARLQHFTESLFDGGDRIAGPPADLSVAMLLKRGEMEADGMQDDPDLQASMFATLGSSYERLGQLDRADILLRRALEEREKLSVSNTAQYLESLTDMGILRRDQRQMDDAETYLRRALTIESKSGASTEDADRSVWALGSVLALRGKYAESQHLLETKLTSRTGEKDRNSQSFADGLAQLGDVRFYLGDYRESEALNRRALAIYRETSGNEHPSVAHVWNNLGHIALNQGHFADAEGDFRKSLTLDEHWYGPFHPIVAEDLSSLAGVLSRTGRASDARLMLLKALDIEVRALGHDHSAVALTLNDLGTIAYNQDADDEAETDFRGALAIWQKVYGGHHQFVGLAYANLTGVYMDRKEYVEAERMARRALSIYQETLLPDNEKLGVIHVKLGRVLLREHKLSEAEPEIRSGYLFFKNHENDEPSYLAGSRKDLIALATEEHNPGLLSEMHLDGSVP